MQEKKHRHGLRNFWPYLTIYMCVKPTNNIYKISLTLSQKMSGGRFFSSDIIQWTQQHLDSWFRVHCKWENLGNNKCQTHKHRHELINFWPYLTIYNMISGKLRFIKYFQCLQKKSSLGHIVYSKHARLQTRTSSTHGRRFGIFERVGFEILKIKMPSWDREISTVCGQYR